MASDPHAVLGIAPDERDPAAIKRAYAAQLKLHRPDQDPEGFRRVREAYQALIARAGTAPDPPQPTPPGREPEPRAPSTDPPPIADGFTDPSAALAAATAAWRSGAIGVEAWQQRVLALAERAPDAVAGGITADDILGEADLVDMVVGEWVVDRWRRLARWDDLIALARRWLAVGDAARPPSARLDAALGLALGLVEPDLAAEFAQRVFHRHRGAVVPEVEQRALLGREMRSLPMSDRSLVAQALDGDLVSSVERLRDLRRIAYSLQGVALRSALLHSIAELAREPLPEPPPRKRRREFFPRTREFLRRFGWALGIVAMLAYANIADHYDHAAAKTPPLPATWSGPPPRVPTIVDLQFAALARSDPYSRGQMLAAILSGGGMVRADDPNRAELLLRLTSAAGIDGWNRARCLDGYRPVARRCDLPRLLCLPCARGSALAKARAAAVITVLFLPPARIP